MRYGSICSGIEAATQAWHPLGWTPAFFSEIEKFPSAVLAHHYGSNMPGEPYASNGVPNYGDMTNFKEWPDHGQRGTKPIDVLVGGTPCQSFSVAGLRKGLDDPRGNLMLTYIAMAKRYQPKWIVWENVPGVLSSNKGRDFGTFLRLLGECGYGFAYRVLDAQYTRVDRFGRAVPQRRRRVFVVGYLGDWRSAAAVLFEPESVRGNPAPSRKAGQGIAASLTASTGGCSGKDGIDGRVIPESVGPLTAGMSKGPRGTEAIEGNHIIPEVCGTLSDGAHNGGGLNGQDAYTGRIIPVDKTVFECHEQDGRFKELPEVCETVTQKYGTGGGNVPLVAFSSKDYGGDAMEDVSPTLRAGNSDTSHANAGSPPAVAFSIMPMNSGKDYKARQTKIAQPLMAGGPTGGNQGDDFIATNWAVRRLTPVECERLQGFPDNFTQIPWRGKEPEFCPDGPRYKAIGNSMAVNCMRWIGQRIEMIEGLDKDGL